MKTSQWVITLFVAVAFVVIIWYLITKKPKTPNSTSTYNNQTANGGYIDYSSLAKALPNIITGVDAVGGWIGGLFSSGSSGSSSSSYGGLDNGGDSASAGA